MYNPAYSGGGDRGGDFYSDSFDNFSFDSGDQVEEYANLQHMQSLLVSFGFGFFPLQI